MLEESRALPDTASRYETHCDWHERMGKEADEIAAEYDVTLADVYAALAYYFDHRSEIDRTIEESAAFVEALRQRSPSKLQLKLQEQLRDETANY